MARKLFLIVCFLALTGTAVAGGQEDEGYNSLYQWQLRTYKGAHQDTNIKQHELLQKRVEEARELQQKLNELEARYAQLEENIAHLKEENQGIVEENERLAGENDELAGRLEATRQQHEELMQTLEKQQKDNQELKDHLIKTRELFKEELKALYTREEGVLDEHIQEIEELKKEIDTILDKPSE